MDADASPVDADPKGRPKASTYGDSDDGAVDIKGVTVEVDGVIGARQGGSGHGSSGSGGQQDASSFVIAEIRFNGNSGAPLGPGRPPAHDRWSFSYISCHARRDDVEGSFLMIDDESGDRLLEEVSSGWNLI